MTYVDGFLFAVPTAKREAFRSYAENVAAIFTEHGAPGVQECWGDDVPEGNINSMHTAVLRRDDETIVFSWVVWPNKTARDVGNQKIVEDPRMAEAMAAMPFDL
jgi:uncharacterized protein YbaA (DUF1428 family)